MTTSVGAIAFDQEVRLIAELKTQRGQPGHWGANLTAGGIGVVDPSPDTRQKQGDWQRNVAKSPEANQKNRESHLGLKYPPRTKPSPLVGRPRDLETRAKLSKAHKGKAKPWLRNKPRSQEVRQAISAALKGKKLGPQSLTHIRNARQARHFQPCTEVKQ